MTKSTTILVLLALSLLVAPLASAHGAAEARSIDTRLLADDDGFFSYDVGAQAGLAEGGGHDLLTLDVREASDLTGAPVVWFRLTWQTDATEPAKDVLRFTADGTAQEFELVSSTTELVSHTFDAAVGPTDVGDGHPKAFDLMLTYESLGVAAGSTLADFEIIGHATDGSTADVAPGTWMTALGELAPYGGDPTHSAGGDVTYTLSGPAQLLAVTGESDFEGDVGDEFTLSIEVDNPLDIEQFVVFGADGDAMALGLPGGLSLAPGEIRTVNITVDALKAGQHNGTLRLFSDLGGFATLPVTLVAHGEEVHDEHDEHASDDDHAGEEHVDDGKDDEHAEGEHDHSDHDHNETDGAADLVEESPGAGFALLAVGLVAIALIRRK